jgi:TP901 family phage tail tape measure protein
MAGSGQHIIVKIGGEVLSSLTSSIRQAQTQISSLGKNVSRTMTDAAGAGAKGFKRVLNSDAYQAAATAAAGVGLALGGSVKTAAKFESALTDIGKISGSSQAELKQLGLQLSALSARDKTNLAPTVLAAGLQDLVAQGLSLDQAVASMEALGKVATATGSELTDVTKTGFQLQNALKIKPTELKSTFDALAFAGKAGAFELKDMAQFMPTIAAAAGTLGIQGKQGAISLGAMMQMVRKDAPDAGQAATRLTDAMLKMTAPGAVKGFAKFGVNIEKVLKDAKAKGINPMEAALDTLQKVTGGDAFKLGEIFGDKEAKLGLLSLMKYRKEYEKLKADAGGSAAAGTVEQDYLRSLNTLQGNLDTFKAATERLGIALGNALLPALSAAANFITPLVAGFAALSEKAPWLTTAIVTLAAVFAGLVVALPFISAGVSVFTALGGAIAAAGGMGAILTGALAAITGPVGLVVLAVIGIGAALVFAYSKVEWFRNAVNGAFEGVKNVVMGLVNFVKGTFQILWGVLSGDTKLIKTGFDNVVNGIKQAFSGLVGFLGSLLGALGQFILSIPKLIGAAFTGLLGLLRNVFTGIVTLAGLVFGGIGRTIGGVFQNVIPTITKVFGGVPQAILAVLFPLPALAAQVFTRFGPTILSALSGVGAKIKGFFGGLFSGLGGGEQQSPASGVVQSLAQLPGQVQSLLSSGLGTVRSAITSYIGQVAAAFQALGPAVGAAMQGLGAFISGALSQIGALFTAAFTSYVAMWQGIGQAIWTAVSGAFMAIVGAIGGYIAQISAAFASIGPAISGPISGAVAQGKALFNSFVSFLLSIPGRVAGMGAAIVDTIINGIRARIGALLATVQGALAKVRALLPGSDAKEGPLSTLTKSGQSLLTTFAQGVNKSGDGGLLKTVTGGLQGVMQTMPGMLQQALPTAKAGLEGLVGGLPGLLQQAVPSAPPMIGGLMSALPGMAQQFMNGASQLLAPTPMGGMIPAPVPAGTSPSGGGQNITANFTINAQGGDPNAIAEKVREVFADLLHEAQAGHRAYLND